MMSLLLQVKKITKSYKESSFLFPGKQLKVLNGISFELGSAEILAIVGESGSGKSTLARQLVCLEQPDAGEILLNTEPLNAIPSVHKKIRMIFQNPAASLNTHKRVFQILEEPLINLESLTKPLRSKRINECLIRVGLSEEHGSRFPHMLSGGQRQRVAIARALILNPDVIVADEAVSALDVSIQAQILNLIKDLRDESGMSWVFITHDLSVVKNIADRVIVLYSGRIMESGNTQEVMYQPLHPYTQNLIKSVPEIGGELIEPGEQAAHNMQDVSVSSNEKLVDSRGCVFLNRCTRASQRCENSMPELAQYGGQSVACFNVQIR
jgi:dipeptide transport system ATP-binding protein